MITSEEFIFLLDNTDCLSRMEFTFGELKIMWFKPHTSLAFSYYECYDKWAVEPTHWGSDQAGLITTTQAYQFYEQHRNKLDM